MKRPDDAHTRSGPLLAKRSGEPARVDKPLPDAVIAAMRGAAEQISFYGCQNTVAYSIAVGIGQSAKSNGPPVDSPREIAAQLPKVLRGLFEYLLTQRTATLHQLHSSVWRTTVVEDAAVKKAAKRLDEKLLELQAPYSIEIRGETVILKQDK